MVKRILASLLLMLSATAFADQLASLEQLFCSGQVAMVARVKAGNSEDCRLHMAAPCDPENAIRLSVTVNEVLAVKSSWDKVMFSTYDPALSPRHVGELVGRTLILHVDAVSGEEVGPYLHNPTSKALADADVERLYNGRMYIFTVEPRSGPGGPYWSGAWSLNSRNWAIKTMRRAAGSDCPALLEDHGRSLHGTPTADSLDRQALVSQVEAQLAHLSESPPGGVIVDQSLAAAREINPGLDETVWTALETEVGAEAVSMMTERGSGFDMGLRTVLDTLSTPELRKLSASVLTRSFADPAFVRFGTALKSSEIDFGNANVLLADAIKSVLEKHGLKVPP
jgi:hypothetical protein